MSEKHSPIKQIADISARGKTMEFRIIQKLSVKSVKEPSKKVESVVKFLTEEFNTIGLNMPYNKVTAKFAEWNETQKTVTASSLDLHKLLFTACFVLSQRIVKDAEKNGYELKKISIPYFFSNKDDIPTVQTRKASEFDNLYYETLDGLKEQKEKESKSGEGDNEGEGKKEINPTAEILALMTKYKGKIDFEAVKVAIADIQKETVKTAKLA